MKIRRYMGNNAQEAILKVKMDLGTDAIILNTRKVRRKGLRNLFSKPMVEVLAAIDEYSTSRKETTKVEKDSDFDKKTSHKFDVLENKFANMEALLTNVFNKLNSDNVASDEDPKSSADKILDLFYSNLIKNEVDKIITEEIINKVREKIGEKGGVNEATSHIYSVISDVLGKPEALNIKEEKGKPTVIIFVGPTGVGKTTTLAKIAADYTLNKNKSVALITTDTYRIAAVEQLKAYAEILGLPISVLYSPNEFDEAIKDYNDKDIVLVDTAGRSHKNASQFEELKSFVTYINADVTFLVISTTISTKNCKEILKTFDFIDNYKLIFTKTDETSSTGLLLNIKYMTKKPLSYITTGQNVPDDIELANIDKIAKSLMGSMN